MKHLVTLRPSLFRSCQISRTARLLPASKLIYNPSYQQQSRTYAYEDAMEAVKQTIAQNFGSDESHKLVSEDQQFDLKSTPSLDGKVAVITGGSEGVGYGCSHTLLSKGISKLFILSVSKEVIDGYVVSNFDCPFRMFRAARHVSGNLYLRASYCGSNAHPRL